ncbi:MAG TPA: o-succinylbenzoate synthase [Acidimicrobiales bacterium]
MSESLMRIERVTLRLLRMPLVRPFRTSFGVETERQVLVATVHTDRGTGWAECAAEAVPLYLSEFNDAVVLVVEQHLVPRLKAAGPLTAADAAVVLRPVKGHRMAKAMLECALLDAELRDAELSFASRLGAARSAVPVGVAVGITDTVERLVEHVAGYVADGYRRVKLKIEPGFDVEPVRAVREAFPDLMLQVDANTAYTIADAGHLAALDAFDLLLIEQPLGDDDLVGHAELAKRLDTPICLDEAIRTIDHCRSAIALGATEVVNIKPARVGGYLAAVQVHDLCVEHGIPAWCGGMLETGLGRAANLALAALPGFTLPGDLSASARYWTRDITEPFSLNADGTMDVPPGPGLGVTVDTEYVDELTVWRRDL